jgi:hypothetical protein
MSLSALPCRSSLGTTHGAGGSAQELTATPGADCDVTPSCGIVTNGWRVILIQPTGHSERVEIPLPPCRRSRSTGISNEPFRLNG